MADWSALSHLVVTLIARRLELIEDFVAFRQTCTSWRAATSLKDFDRSCLRLPLLMLGLPDGFNRKEVDERAFFSLSTRKICKVSLPEAREAMHCFESKGWLIIVGYKHDMRLLDPFTHVQIPLPTHPKSPYHALQTAVLSASPSKTSEYVLMTVFKSYGPEKNPCLAFWKPGDVAWTQVGVPESVYWVERVCYYNGKFYALASPSQILMYDVFGPNPTKSTKIIDLPFDIPRPNAYLVECAGRLLVILPFYECGPHITCHKMVELDVINGTYTNITTLGNSTVFLGFDQGFSIDATKFPGVIEPNFIYFSSSGCNQPIRRRSGMQIYDINRSLESFGGVWVNL